MKAHAGPEKGSKQAVMRFFGMFKDDADLDDRLADLKARRASR